jgi:hypothetical protein
MVMIIFVLIEFFNVKVSLFFIVFGPPLCILFLVSGLFFGVFGFFFLPFFFSLFFFFFVGVAWVIFLAVM